MNDKQKLLEIIRYIFAQVSSNSKLSDLVSEHLLPWLTV